MGVRIVIERGAKRTFASALDWPGWVRGDRTPGGAAASLIGSASRYARVAKRAGVPFTPPRSVDELEVVEELTGSGSTDFGVPGTAATSEDEPMEAAELERQLALLRAAWEELDDRAGAARGHTLRTGPRGGGRDLERILEHVTAAESAYLGQLGARPPRAENAGLLRDAFVDALRTRVAGRPFAEPRRTKHPWSPRYAIRRAAWHVLDHAWEIEDRVEP
ncbi:MAG TPA: hypothetical protein VLA76_05240 [Candidatus Angelobacter sp.]|nr:hypothetical protein [Candidatus Angelobacter sp.]